MLHTRGLFFTNAGVLIPKIRVFFLSITSNFDRFASFVFRGASCSALFCNFAPVAGIDVVGEATA